MSGIACAAAYPPQKPAPPRRARCIPEGPNADTRERPAQQMWPRAFLGIAVTPRSERIAPKAVDEDHIRLPVDTVTSRDLVKLAQGLFLCLSYRRKLSSEGGLERAPDFTMTSFQKNYRHSPKPSLTHAGEYHGNRPGTSQKACAGTESARCGRTLSGCHQSTSERSRSPPASSPRPNRIPASCPFRVRRLLKQPSYSLISPEFVRWKCARTRHGSLSPSIYGALRGNVRSPLHPIPLAGRAGCTFDSVRFP